MTRWQWSALIATLAFTATVLGAHSKSASGGTESRSWGLSQRVAAQSSGASPSGGCGATGTTITRQCLLSPQDPVVDLSCLGYGPDRRFDAWELRIPEGAPGVWRISTKLPSASTWSCFECQCGYAQDCVNAPTVLAVYIDRFIPSSPCVNLIGHVNVPGGGEEMCQFLMPTNMGWPSKYVIVVANEQPGSAALGSYTLTVTPPNQESNGTLSAASGTSCGLRLGRFGAEGMPYPDEAEVCCYAKGKVITYNGCCPYCYCSQDLAGGSPFPVCELGLQVELTALDPDNGWVFGPAIECLAKTATGALRDRARSLLCANKDMPNAPPHWDQYCP